MSRQVWLMSHALERNAMRWNRVRFHLIEFAHGRCVLQEA